MPITIGTLTSRVTVTDGKGGGMQSEEDLDRLVKLVAMRLKDMKKDGDMDDGEIPERMSDSQ